MDRALLWDVRNSARWGWEARAASQLRSPTGACARNGKQRYDACVTPDTSRDADLRERMRAAQNLSALVQDAEKGRSQPGFRVPSALYYPGLEAAQRCQGSVWTTQ